ncbi:class I SAM-dependent methyltransferase [Butyrivibrio sp. X503]|uniref:class I SAM-dependent methyltransferase n=1 Tax=Butyrivibrio sp. X503 TaxID=2364878 RepID=UPI000EA89C2B|nr:class I SAM-dependent methyltransferase [Butyrivibrio sp. X503]RKM54653.1 class I SAM-dependent methyltransferase [Butyrivibrio sp. X503]
MNNVVDYYENYREEDRLTTNNARKIEFLTTVRMFDDIIGDSSKEILDCAAGTGAYAFYLADKGYNVTATDLTPRHIDIINEQLANKPYKMTTAVLDATDMSMFSDDSFDVVLNMGPFYHLTEENMRNKCIEESLRVLRKDGLLVVAYVPKFYLNQMIVTADEKYIDGRLLSQIRDTGELHSDDPKCFWTDTYYSSADEMEELFAKNNVEIISHFAQDGILPMLADVADTWSEEKFNTWLEYHLSVCKEKSILGMSNHVIITGKKK